MNLQFDSINELEQFLMFSAHIGRAFAVAPPDAQANDEPAVAVDTDGSVYPLAQANDEPEGAEFIASMTADGGSPELKPAQGEDGPLMADGGAPVKRKRRTKAEMIEADAQEKAAPLLAEATAAFAPELVQEIASAVPGTGNPFAVASPATQAILEAPNQSAATLAGMAAMQANPPMNDDEAKAQIDAERAAAPRVVESIEHLRACQSFIQAHGMARYNESFRDGLNANITTYTPEQRAQHVAILETLALSA